MTMAPGTFLSDTCVGSGRTTFQSSESLPSKLSLRPARGSALGSGAAAPTPTSTSEHKPAGIRNRLIERAPTRARPICLRLATGASGRNDMARNSQCLVPPSPLRRGGLGGRGLRWTRPKTSPPPAPLSEAADYYPQVSRERGAVGLL